MLFFILGSLRCESPVTPITEEIVQQSIAKGNSKKNS